MEVASPHAWPSLLRPTIVRKSTRSHRFVRSDATIPSYRILPSCSERLQRLFDILIDDVSLDLDKLLSGDELFGLFGLERPRMNRR